MQLREMQHFNNTPLGEMQSGEMQLLPKTTYVSILSKYYNHWLILANHNYYFFFFFYFCFYFYFNI